MRYCVIIPTFNNATTVAKVVSNMLKYTSDIIVVNDGSTDETIDELDSLKDKIQIVSYPTNRGKGYALSKGFDKAESLGYTHAITLDSDGQHFPEDMHLFVEAAEKHPAAMIVGHRCTVDNVPAKNTFANRFANFWFMVQTAQWNVDTQCGYRLYPLKQMRGLRPISTRYEAELEILVRLAWRNCQILSVPVRVYYPPIELRISHFRPGMDFFRISILNTILTLSAIIYGYPSMIFHRFCLHKTL
jgi:glycosyltransferase involved in cell wall biosynthesis